MVMLKIVRNSAQNDIFKIKEVCGLTGGIRAELPHKRDTPPQCHNCQLHGHTQRMCTAPPACVKCLGSHATSKCDKGPNDPVGCTLCKVEGHPANFRGCPKAPQPAAQRGRDPRRAPVRVNPGAPPPPPLMDIAAFPHVRYNQGGPPQGFAPPPPTNWGPRTPFYGPQPPQNQQPARGLAGSPVIERARAFRAHVLEIEERLAKADGRQVAAILAEYDLFMASYGGPIPPPPSFR
jgi:hypothetical protein